MSRDKIEKERNQENDKIYSNQKNKDKKWFKKQMQ